MCGIVGAVKKTGNVVPILIHLLQYLEYRGYDSAGLAVVNDAGQLVRIRTLEKVQSLIHMPLMGNCGIGHTRWATHGEPSIQNAHPHWSCETIAIVHNGIIENHHALRQQLNQKGYVFETSTDTEVIAHLLHFYEQQCSNLLESIFQVQKLLIGVYALGILSIKDPNTLYAVRSGSPMVIGIDEHTHYIVSDPMALAQVTSGFIDLEDGDVAVLQANQMIVYNAQGFQIERPMRLLHTTQETIGKGAYRHFMQKEIFEQPDTLRRTLDAYFFEDRIHLEHQLAQRLKQIDAVHICACGTSFHAGLIAKYWFQTIAHVSCQVDMASEFRDQSCFSNVNTLLILISQSGETADTLAVARMAKNTVYWSTLGICNAQNSSLSRIVDFLMPTHVGPEMGVAATKTFTGQLTVLLILVLYCAQRKNAHLNLHHVLHQLPFWAQKLLQLNDSIRDFAGHFGKKQHALFLGRGIYYPLALEGALKLKEISYIHAEGYAAGELKHGPLALVDSRIPVLFLIPKNDLMTKMCNAVEEVRARQGSVYLIIDESIEHTFGNAIHVLKIPSMPDLLSPLLYAIPLQLLAYHTAVFKGTDVDQPRNLAKSVTVE